MRFGPFAHALTALSKSVFASKTPSSYGKEMEWATSFEVTQWVNTVCDTDLLYVYPPSYSSTSVSRIKRMQGSLSTFEGRASRS